MQASEANGVFHACLQRSIAVPIWGVGVMSEKTGGGIGDASAGILLAEHENLFSRQKSLIERLNDEDRARVRSYGVESSFERGDLLFAQGDDHNGIMIIEDGLIRSYYTAPSGREITLAYWLPGNFVGGPEIFGGGKHMWAAIAARRSRVTLLLGAGLRELAREVPDLALGIIDSLVFKARCYSSLAQMLGTRSLGQRLNQVLLHLVHNYGIPDARGVAIANSFTHQEIANLIGATRQWVTISLNRMQDEGLLSQHRGIILVHRPEALAESSSD